LKLGLGGEHTDSNQRLMHTSACCPMTVAVGAISDVVPAATLAIALLERVLNEIARLRRLFQIRRPMRTCVQVLRNPNPRSSTPDDWQYFV
jgi:single-stranded DNA-specific DHH superfamily exonuclease